jgi:hypothetical protein
LHSNSGHDQFAQSLRADVPLAPLATLGIGGPARFFADCASVESLVAGVAWAREKALPVFILGGGSNIVVADAGFAGLVLRVAIRGIKAARSGTGSSPTPSNATWPASNVFRGFRAALARPRFKTSALTGKRPATRSAQSKRLI